MIHLGGRRFHEGMSQTEADTHTHTLRHRHVHSLTQQLTHTLVLTTNTPDSSFCVTGAERFDVVKERTALDVFNDDKVVAIRDGLLRAVVKDVVLVGSYELCHTVRAMLRAIVQHEDLMQALL